MPAVVREEQYQMRQEQQRQHHRWRNELATSVSCAIAASVKRQLRASTLLSSSSRLTQGMTPSYETSIPRFDREEVFLGSLLGSGGFSHAYEIKAISLRQNHPEENDDDYDYDDDEDSLIEGEEEMRTMLATFSRKKVKGHRSLVLKHIKPKFLERPDKFKRAGVCLIMEGHYLGALQHPHILSIRGWAKGGSQAYASGKHDGFFLILDRLQGTLEDRVKEWRKQMLQYKESLMQMQKKQQHKLYGAKSIQELLFAGRLRVARDLANALTYMHRKRLIYRDLKPSNVGFDLEGRVRLFDFGLTKEIPAYYQSQNDEDNDGKDCVTTMTEGDGMFAMSGRVGTVRYMSPEVFQKEPYNQKTDVFSFGLVLWEMLALEKPFNDLTRSAHKRLVIGCEQRPPIDSSWPPGIQALLHCSWATKPTVRPTMRDVEFILDFEINELRVGTAASDGKNQTPQQQRQLRRHKQLKQKHDKLLRDSRFAYPKEDSTRTLATAETSVLSLSTAR